MRTLRFVFLTVVALTIQVHCFGQVTSIEALSGNNTSASDDFKGSVDPRPGVLTPQYNMPASNVSKEDPHALVYPGYKGKIFVAFMPWFKAQTACSEQRAGAGGWGPMRKICNAHIPTGYDSDNPAQIHKQMDDIASRHFDGVDITLNSANLKAYQNTIDSIFADLNARCKNGICPLQVVIMPDHLDCAHPTTNKTDAGNCALRNLENFACYMNQHYFSQPSYLKVDGHPVWHPFFNEWTVPKDGWNQLWQFSNHLSENCPRLSAEFTNSPNTGVPYLELQDVGGFSFYPASAGAYFWLIPAKGVTNQGQSAATSFNSLQQFYDVAARPENINKEAWGALYAKFNDVLAGWSPAFKPGQIQANGNIIDAECGRTWLRTFDVARNSFAHRNSAFLLVETWNDYDEGTEIESGIGNCVSSMQASINGSVLRWTVQFTARPDGTTGDDSTIDHFAIYGSQDGTHLRLIATIPDNTSRPVRSVALSSLHLPFRTGQLYVQAVGKPSIVNHITVQPVIYRAGPD